MIRDEIFYSENDEILERYALAKDRVAEAIGAGGLGSVPKVYRGFFEESGEYLAEVFGYYDETDGNGVFSESYLAARQEKLWRHVMPDGYETSYLNPAVAVKSCGRVGGLLSAVYADMIGCNRFLAEGRRDLITIFAELWIELLCIAESMADATTGDGELSEAMTDELFGELSDAVKSFYMEVQEQIVAERTALQVDSDHDRIKRIIMDSNLNDPSYLYEYGAYVGENELKTREYLMSLPTDRLQSMADTLTEGYRIGFEITGRDLSKKKTGEIVYYIGFEPMMRLIVNNLAAIGLDVTARPEGVLALTARGKKRTISSVSANKQFDYDHKDDKAYYFDRAFADKRIEILEESFKKCADKAKLHAGPAVIEVFGEPKFTPVNKPENSELSKEQNEISVYELNELGRITNEYIPGEERSFSIIAYPLPCIGERYEEIFDATVEINTLDYMKYRRIQQALIDALDQGESVHVLGKNGNCTDITVQLIKTTDPDHQTKFENCVADVNIPVGEVFTSPVLEGTNGTLFVSRVYLGDYSYDDLRFDFKDGKVVDYTCKNYENEEENKKLIFDRILFKHKTLPIGEFAIGTNTTAYVMGRRLNILDKLPILIAEKTGPHFAMGDTCYSWEEDNPVYNPDGKEIIARENSVSCLRRTDPGRAYFGCHTDITIPYEELESIKVLLPGGDEIPLIENGRFVLPGTEELNIPLDNFKEV